jgi:hypothetical protein
LAEGFPLSKMGLLSRLARNGHMNRLTIDHHASSQFGGVSEPVEVFDENGNLLGHFVPKASLDPSASCPYSEADLARMRAETGGRFLTEIWGSMKEK